MEAFGNVVNVQPNRGFEPERAEPRSAQAGAGLGLRWPLVISVARVLAGAEAQMKAVVVPRITTPDQRWNLVVAGRPVRRGRDTGLDRSRRERWQHFAAIARQHERRHRWRGPKA